jgi:hypothetical protein
VRLKSIGMKLLKYGLLAVIGLVAIDQFADPVLAQSTQTPPDTSASKSGYESMLGNLYTIASMTLKFGGFILVVLGPLIWFASSNNGERSRRGVGMFVGGIMMIGLHYGFQAFVAVIKWIANG